MTRPRFLVPDLDPALGTVTLSPEESHHLVRVLRLSGNDPVVVFDGRGRQFAGRVERADRHRATVTLASELTSTPDHATPIALVQAVLKGDKMDDIVRDATMAGASRIVPVVAERSQVRFSSLRRGQVDERWRRVAIASAKQCGQARLPEIDPPRSFESWLETPTPGHPAASRRARQRRLGRDDASCSLPGCPAGARVLCDRTGRGLVGG